MPDKKISLDKKSDYWIFESIKDIQFEDAYDLEDEITKGPFAKIHKCKPKGMKTNFSVKIIPKNTEKKVTRKDASTLLKLNNANVCRLKEIYESKDTIYLVSDLLSKNEVLERISKRQQYTERDAAKILRQILEGLKYIHGEGLIHRDLKSENFVFESDKEDSQVKITDISLYTLLDKDLHKYNVASATQYCAPEVLRNEMGSSASDMWSLGVFTYILLCGEEPFQNDNETELYKNIFKGSFITNSINFQSLSTNAKDFISKLLIVDPKKRLTAVNALSNSWILGKATKFDNMSNCLDSLKAYINRKKTKTMLNTGGIEFKNNGKVSLCQKYLPPDCWCWFQKKTKYGSTIVDCVKSATENPDSHVGLYAPDPDCYDIFPEIFYPVISDYHKVDASTLVSVHDFGDPNILPEFDAKCRDFILSTRIRVGRTLKGYPMGPKLTRETRENIQDLMLQSFKELQGEFYGDYLQLNELSNDERESLIQQHYLYADADDRFLESAGGYKDWPLNRGMFINRKRTFIVWVNEEDHVRIISIDTGFDVKKVYATLVKGIKLLEKTLEFVRHDKFGYLTFCPTNIGTGLRASVHVRLPRLGATGKLKEICESLNLQVRGIHGENSQSEGGIYDISNKVRIGRTEFDLVNSMCIGIKKLIDEELLLMK